MINDKELTKLLNSFAGDVKSLSKNDFLYAIDIIQQPYIVISGLDPRIRGLPMASNSAAIKKRDEIAAYSEPFLTDILYNEKIDVNILRFAKEGLKLNKLTEHLDDKHLITIIFDNSINKTKINDLKEKYRPEILGYLHEGASSPCITKVKEEPPERINWFKYGK